jgi:hypothetical protein
MFSAAARLMLLACAPQAASDDHAAAWRATEASSPLQGRRERAALLLRAGDPAGALAEAEAGLAAFPRDLELLFQASTAWIWIGNGARGVEVATTLASEVSRSDLAPGDAEAWTSAAWSLLEKADGLLQRDSDLDAALARARLTAIAVLSAAALVSIFLVARSTRGFAPARDPGSS